MINNQKYTNIEIKLDKECPECKGTGRVSHPHIQEVKNDCDLCKDGRVPTELGQMILDLVKKYL